MSRKPENTFIASVHRLIPSVYAEKMNNPYRGGTADVWYSGSVGDLWVEYKYLERIPRSTKILPDLTPQQARWLNNRYDEGRNVAVVLGTPAGGVIYRDKGWMIESDQTSLLALVRSRPELAQWILNQVGTKCQLPVTSSPRPKSSSRVIGSSRL